MPISQANTIVRAVVPKSVAATIARMAKVSGKSRSSVIAEFLTEAEPALRRLVGMLEVAKSQQQLFPKGAVADLQSALDSLSGNATDVLDRVQNALQLPLEGHGKGGRRKDASIASGRRRRRTRTPA